MGGDKRVKCEAERATEILAEISAREHQEECDKCCPIHKDLWLNDGSCPQCRQEKAEEIRGGNWFGITCAILLLSVPAVGQAVFSGAGQYSGGTVRGGAAGSSLLYAQPPQQWVHNFIQPDTQPSPICNPPGGVYAEGDGVLGGATGSYKASDGYTVSIAGLRTAIGTWTGGYRRIQIPAGSLLNSASYITSSGTSPLGLDYSQTTLIATPIISNPAGCLVVESATPPTRYQMLCSHGLPGFGGKRNPGCDGHTISGAQNDIANLWTIRQDDNPGGVSHTAIYFPPGSNHVVFRDFEATILPGSSQSKSGPSHGRISVFADTESHDVGVEYAYFHGWDPGDAGQPAGACSNWTMTGTVNTSGTAVTWVSGKRFGGTFSDGTHLYGQTYVSPQATITINGVDYTIASGGHDPAASDTTLTLTTSAGTQTGVAYTLTNPLSRFTPGCGDDMQDAIEWNADNGWIMWNYIEKQHYWQTEGHSILGGFQNGPMKVAHNWIESASGGFFLGGGAVDNRLGPLTNLEVRSNYIAHDLNWKYLTGGQGHSPAPPWGAGPLDGSAAHDNAGWQWAIKNSMEFKFCVNCLIDGNILQGSWTDGQNGEVFGFAPRVCSGGSVCGIFDANGLPRQGFKNIRISNNWFSSAAEGAGTGGRSDGPGNGGGLSMPTTNIDWINDLWSNIDSNEFGDPAGNHSNMWIGLGDAGQSYLCTMSRTGGVAHAHCAVGSIQGPGHNTTISSIVRTGTTGQTGGTVTVAFPNRHDPMIGGTLTLAVSGTYSGTAIFNGTFTMTGASDNGSTTICDNDATPWIPATNSPCIDTNGRYADAIIYTDNTNANVAATDTLCSGNCSTTVIGDSALSYQTLAYSITDISVGDPILIFSGTYTPDGNGNHSNGMGCTDGGAAGYPTSNFTSYLSGQYAARLPLAVAPTSPTGLDVYYPNTGSDESSGVQCFLDNGSGNARNLTIQNNTVVGGSALVIDNNQFFSQELNNQVFNNIYAVTDASSGACANDKSFITMGTACEGTPSIISFDPVTFGLYGNVLQGRTASNWCASPSGSAGSQTCPSFQSGGTVNTFPSTASCSGSSPDPTCIGFVGFLSGAAFQTLPCDNSLAPFNCPQMSLPWANNLTLSQLALSPSSSYAGSGVNTSAMSAAFTSTLYVCPAGLSCGTSGGPYQDAP